MSFGDKKTIREELLARIHPLLVELKDKLVVLQWDVALQTWLANPGTPNAIMLNAYGLVVITTGALLGPDYHISFVWTFGDRPVPPTDAELRAGIRQLFMRIRTMQARQLQENAQPGPDGRSLN